MNLMLHNSGGIMKIALVMLAAALAPLWAQEIKMPANLDKLAAKADETVNVTLDGALLKMAGRFLSAKGGNDDATKAISGLESVTVRSFEFARDGQYEVADLDAIRAQVKGSPWSRVVGVTSKRDDDNVEVYFKDGGNGTLGGIVVLSAEPRSLTIVSITGKLDPAQLGDLGGHFGIPRLDVALSMHGRRSDR
jgi:hypothetical protein